jgi:hypothetical protein
MYHEQVPDIVWAVLIKHLFKVSADFPLFYIFNGIIIFTVLILYVGPECSIEPDLFRISIGSEKEL